MISISRFVETAMIAFTALVGLGALLASPIPPVAMGLGVGAIALYSSI